MTSNDITHPDNPAGKPGTPEHSEIIVIDSETGESMHSAEVIAHRGASGYRPEHTLASYELAIRMCADVIEPDVVSTKDHVLVVRHENEISGTTDVAAHPEFADRRPPRRSTAAPVPAGSPRTSRSPSCGRCVPSSDSRSCGRRTPASTARPAIPTLAEVLDLARQSRTRTGAPVGVAPETKHPTYFASLGLPLDDRWWRR